MLTMRNNQTKTTYMKHKRRTDNNGLGGGKTIKPQTTNMHRIAA